MRIDATILKNMLVSGANALDNDKEAINNMNVFPVPDGDTGINMTLTLSAVRKMSGEYDAVNTLSSEGIINGYPDNTFRPKNTITRAEAASILYGVNER